MIKEFISAWDENKNKLEEYFRVTSQKEYTTYNDILKAIITKVINPYIKDKFDIHYPLNEGLDINKIHIIDDGHYQGTLIFIVPCKVYQPDTSAYIVFSVDYGSCSGCDTLQHIQYLGNESGLPTDRQLLDYMTLALHMVQKAFYLKQGGYV